MRVENEKERCKRNSIIAVIVIAVIVMMLFIEALILIIGNKNNAKQTSQMLLDQIIRIIEQNEQDEDALMESLKEDYIVRAQAVAYMLVNNPDAETDLSELEKIADLMSVDEIHLFDKSGTIYSGTIPKYYEYSFDSGEQMAYFKPMLDDTTLSMCQDVTPNTAEGKSMMYAIVWKEDGSSMVQVGIEPLRLLNELKRNEISEVVKAMPMYEGIQIYVADKESGSILGASDLNENGKTSDEIGLLQSNIDLSTPVYKTLKINGQRSYCAIEACGDYVVSIIQDCSLVNRELITTLLIVSVYLCIAVAVIVMILRRMNRRIQREKDKRLKAQETAVRNLKYQLFVIEAISKDYTDVMLVDVGEMKTTMLKKDKKMENYEIKTWRPYDETWRNFIDKYVIAGDRANLSRMVKMDQVLLALSRNEEYICNYRICYQGKLYNYQIKYVKVDDEDEHKNMVIGAFRNIDDILEEERRRIQLERQSNTDELTELFNRRSYETDIKEFNHIPKDNFVYIAMDVNGLKTINDTLGHECGDELLRGAAQCMRESFGLYGRIYRIGGDEFAAMIFAGDQILEEIKKNFEDVVSVWSGNSLRELSVSCGYAAKKEFPNMMVNELAKVADARMYKEKERYYCQKGIDRRGRQSAFKIICESYIKVFRVNLTEDSYKEIHTDSVEIDAADRFSKRLSEFAQLGLIQPEDIEKYLAQTNLDDIRRYFREGNQIFRIYYRRLIGREYRNVMMEMISAPEYTDDQQIVFLYIKDITPERRLRKTEIRCKTEEDSVK